MSLATLVTRQSKTSRFALIFWLTFFFFLLFFFFPFPPFSFFRVVVVERSIQHLEVFTLPESPEFARLHAAL